MEFIEKMRGFLLTPTKTFKAERKTSFVDAIKYGLLGLLIMAILTAIITAIFGAIDVWSITQPIGGAAGTTTLAAFFGVIVFGFIGLMLVGLWLHLWVFIFGGKQGIANTLKTVFYAYSPVYVLGWIPIVSFFANIWHLVLTVIGLTKLQKLSTGRAVGAVIVAIVIPLIIIAMLAAWAISIMGPTFLTSLTQLSTLQ